MYLFTDDCLTGIAQIDEEHRMLFQMMGQTKEHLEQDGASLEVTKELMHALENYANSHFAHEEAYMEKIHDPELQRQKHEHDEFRNKISEVDAGALTEEQAKVALDDLLTFLTKWLYRHIISSDIMIGKIRHIPKEDVDNIFHFSNDFRTGITFMDQEHEKLFDILREVHETLYGDEIIVDKYDKVITIVGEMRDYALQHFADEEAYMKRIGYAGLMAQQRAHEAFGEYLVDFDFDSIDADPEESLEELIDYLVFWLRNHIFKMDMLIPLVPDKL